MAAEIKPTDMGKLPSGVTLYSLLKDVVDEAAKRNATVKAPQVLVELLRRVPPADVQTLQQVPPSLPPFLHVFTDDAH